MIRPKRIYEPPSGDDGRRILVDRLWPRGMSRHEARIDEWLKDAAPSTDLRKWYGHDPKRWREFVRRYRIELAVPPGNAAIARLSALAAASTVTLLYASRDAKRNHALVLCEIVGAGAKRARAPK